MEEQTQTEAIYQFEGAKNQQENPALLEVSFWNPPEATSYAEVIEAIKSLVVADGIE